MRRGQAIITRAIVTGRPCSSRGCWTHRVFSLSLLLTLFLPLSVLVHDPPASCPDNAGVGNCKLLISPFPALHSSANMKRVLSERCETTVPRLVEAPPSVQVFLPARFMDKMDRSRIFAFMCTLKVSFLVFVIIFQREKIYKSMRLWMKKWRIKRA